MKKKLYIGLDLGGTALKYGLLDENGNLLEHFRTCSNSEKKENEVFEVICKAINELTLLAKKYNGEVLAIGFGSPGNINIQTGELMNIPPTFKKFGKINIKKIIEEKIKLPVFIDNDANLAALGEFENILNGKPQNILYLTLGTGIGGGVIIDGQLLRGAHYSGGEIGHISINHEGLKCNCGGIGCWEKYASTSAMLNFYEMKTKVKLENGIVFFEKVENKEKSALEILEREYYFVAVGIGSLLNIFNSEMVIIGGGISANKLFKVEKIKQYIQERAMENCAKDAVIVKAKLKNKAGMIGAAIFAKQMLSK